MNPPPELARTLFGNPTLELVALIVIALALIVVALCLGLVTHHSVSERRRRDLELQMAAASMFLAPHIIRNASLHDAVAEARRQFGDRAVGIVLRRARLELRGAVREAIAQELADMGDTGRLIRETRTRRVWRRVAAVRTLGECGGNEARTTLIAASEDTEPEVRRAARDGLLFDADPEAVRVAIESYLRDTAHAAGWKDSFYGHLAWVAPDELRELLTSGRLTPFEEKRALEALADASDEATLPLARERLTAPNAELRTSAARFIGKLGDQQSLEQLVRLLGDEEWTVRSAAARALARLHADDGVCHALGARLVDPTWWVRANAAKALAAQGQRGANALVEVLEGEDVYARDAAMAVLSIGRPEPELTARLRRLSSRRPDDVALANLVAQYASLEAPA